jgi:hypothetical protein
MALFRATADQRIFAFRGFPTQPAVLLLSKTVLSCRYVWLVKAETDIPRNVSRQVKKGVSSKLSTSSSNCLSIRKRSCKPFNHRGLKGEPFYRSDFHSKRRIDSASSDAPLKAKSKLFFSKRFSQRP